MVEAQLREVKTEISKATAAVSTNYLFQAGDDTENRARRHCTPKLCRLRGGTNKKQKLDVPGPENTAANPKIEVMHKGKGKGVLKGLITWETHAT